MRVIIISDVKKNNGKIVTYGLNLAKFYEAEVDILHMIDPRTQHSVSSQVADSQTVAPGEKMSPDEIIEREKRIAEIELDKILSKEASRLNYPLKINTHIEEYSLEKKLTEQLRHNPSSIVLMNAQSDDNALGNKNDILNTINTINGIYIMVPPEMEFKPFNNVMIDTDFSKTDLDRLNKIAYVLHPHNATIIPVSVAAEKNDGHMHLDEWKKSLESILSTQKINITNLDGENYDDAIIKHTKESHPNLTVLFKREKNLLNRLFKKSLTEKMLEHINTPLLYYSF